MKITRREIVLFIATGGTALLGLTILGVRPKIDEWREIKGKQKYAVDAIEKDKEILRQKEKWENEFKLLSEKLPLIPKEQKVDVYWLSMMDQVASRSGLKIMKRQVGEEKSLGDIYELSIECKEWEGTLENLVYFLIELQEQGAMLDLRQLLVKPKGKGVLRGRFMLYCAYRR